MPHRQIAFAVWSHSKSLLSRTSQTRVYQLSLVFKTGRVIGPIMSLRAIQFITANSDQMFRVKLKS